MNAFLPLRAAALEGRLPPAFAHLGAYFAGHDFLERTSFTGESGMEDAVRVTGYLLGRLAVDPPAVDRVRERLASGWVQIEYFGVSNPVPGFELSPQRDEHRQLRELVQHNVVGPMFNAATRLLRWRQPHRTRQAEARMELLRRDLKSSLAWPSPEDFRRDPLSANAAFQASSTELNRRLYGLRQQRQQRLAVLASAACPGLAGWSELLVATAANALSPGMVAEDEGTAPKSRG